MIVRLGYVAISNSLDVTTSSTITYTNFIKNNDYKKLDKVIKSNLRSLIKILKYNEKNNIHFYRLSSKLIPLATKKEVIFDYLDKYNKYYENISKIITTYNMRIDIHTDEYVVLNSTNKDIVNNSIDSIIYHYNILNNFNIKNKIIILHVGSSVLGKDNSIKRFINNFNKLPDDIKKCIALENDDKVYNILDILNICKKLNIVMILDYHHYLCNKGNIDIKLYLNDIFNTWNDIKINPKVHYSSPKSKKEYRSHSDYVDIDEFIKFLNILKKVNRNIDIMLEVKAKDDALFRLVRQLKYYNYIFIDDTTFELK